MKTIVLLPCVVLLASLQPCDAQQPQQPIKDLNSLIGRDVVAQRTVFCQPGTFKTDTDHAGKTGNVVSVKPSPNIIPTSEAALQRLPPQLRATAEDQQHAATVVVKFDDGQVLDTCYAITPGRLAAYLELVPAQKTDSVTPAQTPNASATPPSAMTSSPAAVAASLSSPSSGPFGFEKGMTKDQVIAMVGKSAVTTSSSDAMLLNTAPKPHPDFNEYVLLFSPQTGLVKVDGYGNTIETGDWGTELQTSFSNVVAAMSRKYGSPTKTMDFCIGNNVECENQYWMLSLQNKNRSLAAFWTTTTFPNHVITIYVSANAKTLRSGNIRVSYELEGFPAYANQLKTEKNNTF